MLVVLAHERMAFHSKGCRPISAASSPSRMIFSGVSKRKSVSAASLSRYSTLRFIGLHTLDKSIGNDQIPPADQNSATFISRQVEWPGGHMFLYKGEVVITDEECRPMVLEELPGGSP